MIRCAVVVAAFLTVSLNVFAQDKKGPLADLPSKPGRTSRRSRRWATTSG